MVRARHKYQRFGYFEEATPGVDQIVATYYRYGKTPTPVGNFLTPKHVISPTRYGGSFEVDSFYIPRSDIVGTLGYLPTNAHALFRVLGDCGSGAGDPDAVHTIVPNLPGVARETYTHRWISKNDESDQIISCAVGGKTKTLAMLINRSKKGAAMAFGETIQALKLQEPPETDDPIENQPSFPNAKDDYFRPWANNFVFTWDGDDFADYLRAMTITIDRDDWFDRDDDGKYPLKIIDGDITVGFTASVERADGTQIFEDFIAMPTANAFKDVVMTIYKTATEYITVNLGDIALETMPVNHTQLLPDQVETYELLGVAETISCPSLDGLANARYND